MSTWAVIKLNKEISNLISQLYDSDDNINDVYDVKCEIGDDGALKIVVLIGYDDFSDPDILNKFILLLEKCKKFSMKRVDNKSTKYLFTIKDEFIQEV